jgi:hypothetical protein
MFSLLLLYAGDFSGSQLRRCPVAVPWRVIVIKYADQRTINTHEKCHLIVCNLTFAKCNNLEIIRKPVSDRRASVLRILYIWIFFCSEAALEHRLIYTIGNEEAVESSTASLSKKTMESFPTIVHHRDHHKHGKFPFLFVQYLSWLSAELTGRWVEPIALSENWRFFEHKLSWRRRCFEAALSWGGALYWGGAILLVLSWAALSLAALN